MAESIYVPDFRFLAKAYPETRARKGVVSCTIGYSLVHQRLIRYPTLPPSHSPSFRRWVAVEGEFSRGDDGRDETWFPTGGLRYASGPKVTPRQGVAELRKFVWADGIPDFIREKQSIGVLEPLAVRPYWTNREQRVGENGIVGQPYRLRVRYRTADGKDHDQTILDWQFYEAVRRFSGRYEDPYGTAVERLWDPEWTKLFVVGNIHSHPHSYVVVGVLLTKVAA